MYEPIIQVIAEGLELKTSLNVTEVIQKYGINVNEKELIKALSYDRNQYDKGYTDAIDDMIKLFEKENFTLFGNNAEEVYNQLILNKT